MKKKLISFILLISVLICSAASFQFSGMTADAAATSLYAISQFTMKKLPIGRAAQQIAFLTVGNDEYIFAGQRIDSVTYISRLKINRTTKTAQYLDHVELSGYGHGESLEVNYYDGKYYLWVGSGASSSTTYYWSTTISRFEYTPDASSATGAKITNERVLTNLAYATKTGGIMRSGCSIARSLVALSEKDDRLLIFSKVTVSSTTYSYCTIYTLSSLNKALSDSTTKNYSLKNAGGYVKAHFQFSLSLPNGSIQGLELVGTNGLYCSGGASGQDPTIYKFTYTASSVSHSATYTVDSIRTVNYGTKTKLEIESLKYENGTFYCSFNPGESKANTTEVYSLNENLIEDSYLYANKTMSIKGLPVSNTIQNFDFTDDKKTLFVTQQSSGNTYVSRCVISESGKTATLKDYIILSGYGIGESFAVDEQNGGIYLWVGSAPVTGDDNYSTTVTRLKYNVDASASTGASFSNRILLTDLLYSARASESATAASAWESGTTVSRAGFAVTKESTGSQRLVLRVKCASGNTYYPIYDLKKLDAYLNTLSATSYSLKNAYSYLCNTNMKFEFSDLPYSSFQGMDIDGIGSNSKFIYFIGGSAANKARISKTMYTNGGTLTQTANYYVINAYAAPQGIKIYDNKMYISFTADDNKNGAGIYVLEQEYAAFTEETVTPPVDPDPPVIPEDKELIIASSSDLVRETVSGYDTLTKVSANQTANAFLKNFTNNNKLEVTNSGGTVISDSTYVGTGFIVRSVSSAGAINDSAAILIYCDTDGDGIISANDYLIVKSVFKNKASLSGLYKAAADTDGNGKLTVSDYIMIKRKASNSII